MGWNRFTIGCRCCGVTYPPNACTTYRVQVRNQVGAPNGDPQAGIAASLARRQGSITPPGGTAAPVSGFTDADGWLTYPLSTTIPENVTSGSATIPDGGPTVTNTATVKVGNVCTYPFVLCRRYITTHYLNGDGGSFGDKLVRTYILSTGDGTGNPTNSASYSYTAADPKPDAASWWYDLPVQDTFSNACDATQTYHQKFWDKGKYNFTRVGTGSDGRATVYAKSICVKIYRRPIGGGTPTLLRQATTAWDSTTWDGTPTLPVPAGAYDNNGAIRMRYVGGGIELIIYKNPQGGALIALTFTEIANVGGLNSSNPLGGGFADLAIGGESCVPAGPYSGYCYSATITDGTCSGGGPGDTPGGPSGGTGSANATAEGDGDTLDGDGDTGFME